MSNKEKEPSKSFYSNYPSDTKAPVRDVERKKMPLWWRITFRDKRAAYFFKLSKHYAAKEKEAIKVMAPLKTGRDREEILKWSAIERNAREKRIKYRTQWYKLRTNWWIDGTFGKDVVAPVYKEPKKRKK